MRIATWNVNSVRVRCARLLAWLASYRPDVLCIQEIKCLGENFPTAELLGIGYHAAVFGQKTYNGVAIVAREPPRAVSRGLPANDPQARLIAAEVGGVQVVCVYVPNGQQVDSDQYAYKRAWLQRLQEYVARGYDPSAPVVLAGDFNIAPQDRDIADMSAWGEGIFAAPAMRDAIAQLEAWGFEDVFRRHNDAHDQYSWWDYRRLAFAKNRGLRIDLLYATKPLARLSTGCFIDREERRGKQPSDHAPVVADFAWR